MATHDPTFCDITWGAGGTTADLTLEIAGKMQNMVGKQCATLNCPIALALTSAVHCATAISNSVSVHLAGVRGDNDAFDLHKHAPG